MSVSHSDSGLSFLPVLPPSPGPPAATFNVVFDNAAFDDDDVVTDELAFLSGDSCDAFLTAGVTFHTRTTSELNWNVSEEAIKDRHGSLPLEPRKLLALLRRSLKQGLKFTLRGPELRDVLGQRPRSMRFFLASSTLTNLHDCKETSWDDFKNTEQSGRSASFNSIKQDGTISDVNVNKSPLLGNFDQSTAQRESFDSSCQSANDHNAVSTTEEPCCGSRMILPDDSNADISSSLCEIMVKPTVNSSYTVKRWRLDRSFGKHQVGKDKGEVFLSHVPQDIGNDGQLDGHTAAINKNTSVVHGSQSPGSTLTNQAVHACDDFESINKFGPEDYKQKSIPTVPHMHRNKVPSLSEEQYIPPRRNVPPFWPSSESQCHFPRHIHHFPQRCSRNLFSRAPPEYPQSCPGFQESCPCQSVSHPWSHSGAQKYKPEKCFSSYHQNPLDQQLKCRSNRHCYSSVAQTSLDPFACNHPETCFYQNHFFEKEKQMPSYVSAPCFGCFTSYDECHSSMSECQFQNYSKRPSSFTHEHTGTFQGHLSKSKSKKLLWVSEEEAEIIRLIRLSQDINGSSSSHSTSRQDSPILSMKTGSETPDDVNLNDQRDKMQIMRACSSSSMEDFFAKPMEGSVLSMVDLDKKGEFVGSDEQTFSLDCGKVSSSYDYQINLEKKAASCIQYFWRKHLERKEQHKEEEKRLEALSFISEMPAEHDCLTPMAITAMKNGDLVSWHSSMLKATEIIQRAWRELLKRRHEKTVALQSLPRDMKELHEFIVTRHINNGCPAPSYEKFIKCMKRLQAATEGARIRRRLKSRRLQTIIKEIKEIRLLVQELSNEPTSESSPNLLPQLSIQLQQKMLQLHTALSGTQDAARVLLRRCPATPIVIGSSKTLQTDSSAVKSGTIVDTRSSGNLSVKSSTESFSSQKKKLVQIANFHVKKMECSQSSGLTSNSDNRISFMTSHSESSIQKASRRQKILRNEEVSDVSHVGNKEKVSKHLFGVSTTKVNSRNQTVTNRFQKTEQVSEQPQNETKPVHAKPSRNADCLNVDHSDREDGSHNLDAPRHPFLRRKSKAMPPQKLDWSKVKPMVSSRLEPELKTRLLKTKFRGTSLLRKKRNFSEIKSRLFSYEKTIAEEASGIVKKIVDQTMLSDHGSKEVQIPVNKSSHILKVKHSKRPSLRYFQTHDLAKEENVILPEPRSHQTVPTSCSNKINNRYDNCSYFSLCSSFEDTRLSEADIHQRKLGYSNMYNRSSEESLNEQVFLAATSTSYSDIRKSQNSITSESADLEMMFQSARKDGRGISLASFFPSNQQDGVIPRLHQGSSLFKFGARR